MSEFVKAHPDSDFTPYVETLLAASRDFQDRSIKAKGVKFIEFFEQEHYVIIAYGAPRNLTNTVTKVVDDFNMLNYKDQDLKTSNLILDKQTNFTMISQFPGAKSSLSYYEKLILDPKISEELPINELEVFTITKDNFTIFYQTKELKGYLSFFKTHY